MLRCGMCRSDTIPAKKGTYICSSCGQGHEVTVLNDGVFMLQPYPRDPK
ncbi:hypothetical protein CPT_Mater218 [Bacillus phage Mater]|uniref:Uncharacterized protein n=1 Tax=Bacillus phage Mater TaxID=1540090 RepID=A0A0A0RMT1_9CAUD|nr:hypothetical protein CPT_Mater218 [Bacillus phage Mater]AIW03375.1 hypothetical protein CPT_Mater218 [Bacillus phage Mater]